MKAIQKFTSEYLEACKKMKPENIVKFLDDFRQLHAGKENPKKIARSTKLISMKVQLQLLHVFKEKCNLLNIPYQTQIKKLMLEWLDSH